MPQDRPASRSCADGEAPRIGSAAKWAGAILEKRLEIEAGEMRFAADDAQVERLGDAQVAGEVVGRYRSSASTVVVLEFAAIWMRRRRSSPC